MPSKPFFFLKPPSSLFLPFSPAKDRPDPYASFLHSVWIPRGHQVHYEIELAFVVARNIYNLRRVRAAISPNEFEKYWQNGLIACYAIGESHNRTRLNVGVDLTARDIQDEAKQKGLPWTAAKG
jgi:acylpyruvate hydrolase